MYYFIYYFIYIQHVVIVINWSYDTINSALVYFSEAIKSYCKFDVSCSPYINTL